MTRVWSTRTDIGYPIMCLCKTTTIRTCQKLLWSGTDQCTAAKAHAVHYLRGVKQLLRHQIELTSAVCWTHKNFNALQSANECVFFFLDSSPTRSRRSWFQTGGLGKLVSVGRFIEINWNAYLIEHLICHLCRAQIVPIPRLTMAKLDINSDERLKCW